MFILPSDNVKKAMMLANDIASEHGHEYICIPHMLLAILNSPPGIVHTAIQNLGINIPDLIDVTKKNLSDPKYKNVPASPPQAKLAIEFAMKESNELKLDIFDLHHLWLGILKVEISASAQLFSCYGISYQSARQEIHRLLQQ